ANEQPPVTILASDIDERALVVAERAEYTESGVEALSPERRRRFLQVGGVPGRWAITSPVRRLVGFRLLNLARERWSVEGPFDVILCRNVLMYLEARFRESAVQRLRPLLANKGLLILDPTEHLGAAAPLFTTSGAGVYVRSPAPQRHCHRMQPSSIM